MRTKDSSEVTGSPGAPTCCARPWWTPCHPRPVSLPRGSRGQLPSPCEADWPLPRVQGRAVTPVFACLHVTPPSVGPPPSHISLSFSCEVL